MQLTIVGLGLLGTSVGIAAKAAVPELVVTGHDPERQRVGRAKKLRAIDKTHWNLLAACERADLVLLDLSPTDTEKVLEAVCEDLKPGVVLMDTAPLKRPVLDAAARLLPKTASFVGGHLVLGQSTMDAEPSADVLKDAIYYLVAPESASTEALDLAAGLASVVGATPHFIDAMEHDGLVAGAQLPLLAALTAIVQAKESPGWRERIGLLGREFFGCGLLTQSEQAGAAEMVLANADNLAPWLDEYLQNLVWLREIVAKADNETLQKMFETAREAHREWSARSEIVSPPTESQPHRFGGWRELLLGGSIHRKPRG